MFTALEIDFTHIPYIHNLYTQNITIIKKDKNSLDHISFYIDTI